MRQTEVMVRMKRIRRVEWKMIRRHRVRGGSFVAVKLVMEGNGLLMENVRESLKNMVVEVVFGY